MFRVLAQYITAVLVIGFLSPFAVSQQRANDGQTRYQRYARGLMSQYDSDKDGKLSQDELRKMRRPPTGADANKDGFITESELVGVLSGANRRSSASSDQFYEVRSYVLGDKGDAAAIDEYLSNALLPALGRQGVGPVGVFANSKSDQTGSPRIIVVIPHDNANAVAAVKFKVESDSDYQAAAKAHLGRGPNESPYQRIESELLIAMDCMPRVKVPDGSLNNKDRVYELRIYESPNEHLGNLKVDMFNSGEVPIFLDCKIQPIFIGQSVIGPYTPNLTYLTMYSSETAREKGWKAFREHPDWKVLKEVAKYKGTVSKIHKYVLVPKGYSQM